MIHFEHNQHNLTNYSTNRYESATLNGDLISDDLSCIRGHGTYLSGSTIKSNLMGQVESVNRLVIVHPLNSKYKGNTGDVVIGRVVEIVPKKWLLDIQSDNFGQLMLTSIGLPDGVQRRKTEEDELQMRKYFTEYDVVIAEVQQINFDGTINLQTRNDKYGKADNGVLVKVRPSLVKTCPSHFLEIGSETRIILGKNGYIWIQGNNFPIQAMLFNILEAMNIENISISDQSLQSAISICKVKADPLKFTKSKTGRKELAEQLIISNQ
eukprot:NODE_3_length_80033_cov_0.932970.p34 type:complete len:267 gc:universal NODE_3_length_80033_cov_0.932970:62182-62982(+)